MTHFFRAAIILYLIGFPLFSQEYTPETLRGEVRIELEPVYGGYVDENYPLDTNTASRRALEEAALFYSGMIYGWSFYYDIGEKARGIAEFFELEPLGSIPWGDSGLRATDVEIKGGQVRLWTEYRLTEAQKRRAGMWRTGNVRTTQAVGFGPLGSPAPQRENEPGEPGQISGWLAIRKTSLEDAARASIRALLRLSERNRPKEVTGFISLSAFPRYFMDGGHWAASARFKVEITEIIPFAAY
jgi:hypothetical protein